MVHAFDLSMLEAETGRSLLFEARLVYVVSFWTVRTAVRLFQKQITQNKQKEKNDILSK